MPRRSGSTSSATRPRRIRAASPSSSRCKAVTVVDPLTVRLELSRALCAADGAACRPRRHDGVAEGGARARRQDDERGRSAPARIGSSNGSPQDRIVFEKFERYWNAAAITIDRVVYLPIPDDTVRLANLRAGGFQLIERVAPTDLATVRGDRARAALREPVASATACCRSTSATARRAKTPLGSNAEAARGLRAVARSRRDQPGRLRRRVHPEQPAGGAGHAVLRQGLPGAVARSCPRQGARRRERRGSACRSTLLIAPTRSTAGSRRSSRPWPGRRASTSRSTSIEAATLLGRIKSGDYEVSLLIWSGRADPDANISIWVACDGFVNWGRYCDPKLDEILRRARSTTDARSARQALCRRPPRSISPRGRTSSSIT